MRVSLKYNATPTSCESFQYGEVEDYTVIITDSTLSNTDLNFETISIYPNPFSNKITIKLGQENIGNTILLKLFDLSGRLIMEFVDQDTSGNISFDNVKTISNGPYFLKISDTNTNQTIMKRLIKN